jgi:glycerol-3-phosphate dehydrogenase (NAD(P)+)
MNEKIHITVFGSGSFGTAIAHVLSSHGLDVTLWGRDESVIREIQDKRTNQNFLADITLHPFAVTTNLKDAVSGKNFFIFAVPCQALRDFLTRLKPLLPPKAILVNLAKGIEIATLKTPSEIFSEILGKAVKNSFATVSGPTFASEMVRHMPTGAVVASLSDKTARLVQSTLSTQRFRLYRLTDLAGVELGGALKNIMAIGVGIAEGLGFGYNTRAGLITRCLYEMTELGIALGAKARTFSGLSGIGDLILTCTGDLSRNRQMGLRLGRGEKLPDILKSLGHVVEGVPTAEAVYHLSLKLKIDMPNTTHVYKILHENFSPKEAVNSLLSRELKSEYE